MNMLTYQDVIYKLRELGIEHILDETSTDVELVITKTLTVLTNNIAKKTYDEEHPERIVAFIVFPEYYRVIVNNRTTDLNILKFWNTPLASTSISLCDICYNKLHRYIPCFWCNSKVCAPCDERLTFDSAKKCPICTRWNLYGSGFGLPNNMLSIVEQDKSSMVDGINRLRRIFEHMDGQTDVLVRIDKQFDNTYATWTRLFYVKQNMIKTRPLNVNDDSLTATMRNIRTRRENSNTHDFLVYTFRRTFVIDELPTMEVSVFKIGPSPDFKLFQYGIDAWLPIFEMTKTKIIKVTYIEPYDFRQDLDYFDLLKTIPTNAGNSVCMCSVATINDITSMNFNVINKNITTMHTNMIDACLSIMFASKQDIYIIWRDSTGSHIICGYILTIQNQKRTLVELNSIEIKDAITKNDKLRI